MLFPDIKLLFTWIEKLDRQIPTKLSIRNAGTPIISRKTTVSKSSVMFIYLKRFV